MFIRITLIQVVTCVIIKLAILTNTNSHNLYSNEVVYFITVLTFILAYVKHALLLDHCRYVPTKVYVIYKTINFILVTEILQKNQQTF